VIKLINSAVNDVRKLIMGTMDIDTYLLSIPTAHKETVHCRRQGRLKLKLMHNSQLIGC